MPKDLLVRGHVVREMCVCNWLLDKAMVFPVVMYKCESWTIWKAECQRIDALETVVLEKTLESPLGSKDIQPVHPKGNQS